MMRAVHKKKPCSNMLARKQFRGKCSFAGTNVVVSMLQEQQFLCKGHDHSYARVFSSRGFKIHIVRCIIDEVSSRGI